MYTCCILKSQQQMDMLVIPILHAEYHRPADKPVPGRYSRHYYDVAMLAQTAIRTEALADMDLLASVVRHKTVFYPSV